MPPRLNVLIAAAGLGRLRRGLESFADECFDALRRSERVSPMLIHGPGGVTRPGEFTAPVFPQGNFWVKAYAHLRAHGQKDRWKHEAYTVEHYSFALSVARQALRHSVDVVLFNDPPVGIILKRLRRLFGWRYRTLLSNGAPFLPPYPFADHVQQLVPFYYEQACRAGVPPETQSMVPYGFAMPAGEPVDKAALRQKLRLPARRPVLICVAAINASHKRLDYLIDEAAALGGSRPFLLFLGQTGGESDAIKARAAAALRADDYRFECVTAAETSAYYQASDLFVLASVHEGFGRVFVEAMSQGLPCLAHDYPIARYVLGDLGFFADFTRPGNLTDLLRACLQNLDHLARGADERRRTVRARFSWESLLPAYEQLLFTTSGQTPAPGPAHAHAAA